MITPTSRGGRAWRWSLVAAGILLLVPGLRRAVALATGAEGERVMCEGLPDYAAVVARLAETAHLRFWVDPADPRASERYFCAQLAIAPRLLDPPPANRSERRAAARLPWTLVDGPGDPRLAAGDFAWRRFESLGGEGPP